MHSLRANTAPALARLALTDGTIESLKWLALVLMTGDHINKYLFNATLPVLYEAGRVALPLFVFVLAYNLARPTAFESGVYIRTMKRLVLFGTAASIPYTALGGLVAGVWPFNVMFTLLIIVTTLYLIEKGSYGSHITAAMLFLVGGGFVEFWWPAVALGLAVWWYQKQPSGSAATAALLSCLALWFINGNFWALALFPLVLVASRLDVPMPRLRWSFYCYYPLHLALLWLIRIPMSKAGYLFL